LPPDPRVQTATSDGHVPAPLGLYIHIPFCSAICNYCNFNRGLFDPALKARYVDALVAEIHQVELERGSAPDPGSVARGGPNASLRLLAGALRTPRPLCDRPEQDSGKVPHNGLKPSGSGLNAAESPTQQNAQTASPPRQSADTIYFGGGTPSLLEPFEVRRIIEACNAVFDLAWDREVTLEANPESVSEERLAAYRLAGVNRISFGVQSFRDDELRRLSRLHGAARARVAYDEARRAGFDNISLDLMMWLPAQRLDEWLESIDQAIALRPEHLSLYLLEVYPNSPLKDEMARARWSQAPDEDAAAMYLEAMERLDAAGYEQYEISNVALPGRESCHNLKYWMDGAWLGFGCGAHSTLEGARWKNLPATRDYIDCVSRGQPVVTDHRRLSLTERVGDALFTGLRLTRGVNLDVIRERYGVDVWERYGAALEPFLHGGFLLRDDEQLRLTRQGMLVANEVMAVFV
jgi:putative oxygen-independent coproporphyrinogen III oxidase